MTKVALAVLLLATSAPLAWAAEPQGQDRAFLDKAMHDGVAEVELGKVAARQAESDAVKRFGQRMVDDHQKANQTLMDVARQQGSKEASANRDLPKLEPADEKKLHALEALKGRKFDETYMRDMIRDHEKAVALFRREAKEGKDEPLRKTAESVLPTLEEHLKMAREVGGQVGVKG
jgi:putative membrane protein